MIICGIDEAGRGPLAGPVCAAAVILPPDFNTGLLNDSKKLNEKKRDELEKLIRETAVFGIGWASNTEIDDINILQATFLAMKRAWNNLISDHPELSGEDILLQIDGNRNPKIGPPSETVVKGDAKIPQIMAASILAKTARDRFMREADKTYPGYGFAVHKGYPTKSHREAISKLGFCPIHRRTFTVKTDNQPFLF